MTTEITEQFREAFYGTHLGQCAGLTVEHSDEETQEATLSCPHGLRSAFEFIVTA